MALLSLGVTASNSSSTLISTSTMTRADKVAMLLMHAAELSENCDAEKKAADTALAVAKMVAGEAGKERNPG
ncbi:hypothetical protein [Nitratireductor sp. XY-223]|uniref:hypothetical protein n=1 Tax=Nitratireductor sp. XY-223 TaxID=2561926 RepID=UPI0010AA5DAB|nr:hypothetical protein [Nitratireductor sp. XY-223]